MTTQNPDPGAEVQAAWSAHRRHLLAIGLRMLGNLGDAEDVVQEAFGRLVRADAGQIDDTGGWLVVVVSRLCLDRLRAGRRHPTDPVAALGDTEMAPAPDPADQVTLDDSVGLALHRVLERLSPAERTSFVLHDVFQYSFDQIGEIVGRSPAACRQLASRARRAIADDAGAARFGSEPAERREVTERFIAACATGDLQGLLAVLDPAVDGEGDVGGSIGVRAAAGRDIVAPQLLGFFAPPSPLTLLALPSTGDDASVVGVADGRVMVLLSLAVEGGVIRHIHALVDPAKLAPVAARLAV